MLLEFLNMGTTEILLMLLIPLLFFAGLFFVIVLIVKTIKKKEKSEVIYPVNHYTVNVNGLNEPGKVHNPTSVSDVGFKEERNSKIALPQQSEIRYVEISHIIRCEADDNYTKFFLDGESILVSRSLKEYADQLKPVGFLRTHQTHLVNPLFVKSWLKEDGGTLLMTNGDKIPVSKPNRETVKAFLGK